MDQIHNQIIFDKTFFVIPKTKELKPALFLDRDGVLIKDMHYIKLSSEVVLEKGVLELMRLTVKDNIPVVVVSNQSGISKGLLSWSDYENVTRRMLVLLGSPCPLLGIYANSHSDHRTPNNWRKPNPDMLLTASENLKIDLTRSIMVGDRLSDLLAGCRAGVRTLCHVLTGHGAIERDQVASYVDGEGFFHEEKNSSKIFLLNDLRDFPSDILRSLNSF